MVGPSRRVLFVDDDPQLLSGLSKALRKHRDRWAMVFAGSGEAALAEVRRADFDVVISDMRMPAMDGASLLGHIRDQDPSTIRMILSGFSDRTAFVRALPVAHQFFNKPCNLTELAAAIDQACELRALFTSEPIQRAAARLGELPPAPVLYHELAAQLVSGEVHIPDIAEVIERDAELCARVLQIASGPMFGTGHAFTSIADAAGQLGIELMIGLALASYAFALAQGVDRPPPEIDLAELQRHSLQVARAARRLAGTPEAAGDAFIAGLVHDIGKLVIAIAFPEVVAAAREDGRAVLTSDAERRLLGTSHAELGAWLLGRWGLPLPVVDAIAHHDEPNAPGGNPVLAALRAGHTAVATGPD